MGKNSGYFYTYLKSIKTIITESNKAPIDSIKNLVFKITATNSTFVNTRNNERKNSNGHCDDIKSENETENN